MIKVIDENSPHLQTVIELGDANKATLSFFRKGAFCEHAARRQIIVALDPQAACIGYLLYGYSRLYDRITIIHLCLDPSHRRKGVARKLVDYLIKITQQYSGIGLTCRRDYKLDNTWSKLGFVPQYDKPAKTPGKELTYWWLDHGHSNLFSNAATRQREEKLCVVIDTNIFFDLYDPENINNEESKALLADWLHTELDLCLTDAIFNKINTITNIDKRKHQHSFAKKFTRLPCPTQKLDTVYKSLSNLFSKKAIGIDEFELLHIARTIASDFHIFVTRDIHILDIGDELYDHFRLSIIHPNNLIIQLDELRRKPEYQPVRLAGTLLKQNRVQIGQQNILTDYFQSCNETRADFQQRLRRFLAEPDKFECLVILENENQPVALVVYDRHKIHELEIPILRVGSNPLAATIAHHLLFQAASVSAREQRQFTRITDPYLEETLTKAIQEDAFIRVKNGWLRANIAISEKASQLSLHLVNLANNFGQEYDFCRQIAEVLNNGTSTSDNQTMTQIERFLWPAKVTDADIPILIIPIDPHWAKDLFDDKLAYQYILGAKTELALNREAVYYCSGNKLRGLEAPGRILWYVSDDRGYYNVKSIRACSRLDEVIIGKPKTLFRQFRKFGVYEWEKVFQLAKNDLNNDIIAIRFSDTEVFSSSITLEKVQQVLGNRSTIQSRFRIPPEIFVKLYSLGTQS
nr:GNAT family N-acetyltransferase [Coleofasciculus sp. FACHB-SPT36]